MNTILGCMNFCLSNLQFELDLTINISMQPNIVNNHRNNKIWKINIKSNDYNKKLNFMKYNLFI